MEGFHCRWIELGICIRYSREGRKKFKWLSKEENNPENSKGNICGFFPKMWNMRLYKLIFREI